MGSDLQIQVTKLVGALREITKREMQQVIERVHEDCSKVRDGMSQALSIQYYLASLLSETDPFLLIWVRTDSLMYTLDLLTYKCMYSDVLYYIQWVATVNNDDTVLSVMQKNLKQSSF